MIAWLGAATAALSLPACRSSSSPAAPPAPSFFTDAERRALGALANAVLPADQDPGGEALGAVPYIERLLTALDGLAPGAVPEILAGGPYSGRQPFSDGNGAPSQTFPGDDYIHYLPLDRVSLAAWQLALFGSSGVDGGGPNDAITGVVIGLRDQVKSGVQAAMQASAQPLETLDAADLATALAGLDRGFHDTLIELVAEAAFGAPEYGGNLGLAGWTLTHFEGDSQPLGFSVYDASTSSYRERPDAPVSTANPGADPDPLDDDTRAFVLTIVQAAGGMEFP
jgi:hypothetical protein